jgi:hypothetical protein
MRHNGRVPRRVAFSCALILVAAVSGCWMFGALGDFPDSGTGRDAESGTDHDTGQDGGRPRDTGPAHDALDENKSKDGPTDAGFVIVPAFYVSTKGNDGNDGSVMAPFATLGKAQTAMQESSSIKTTYIRAGSYALPNLDCGGQSCGLNLLSGTDDGETWSYYPPDGVDSADFTGGSTDGGNGLITAINVGAQRVTINGLSIHDFRYAGIGSGGGTGNLTVENCIIYNGYYSNGDQDPGGFSCYGCSNTTLSHNVIHDIGQFGIYVAEVNGDISNLLVTGNVIYNTCEQVKPCGALTVDDSKAVATNIQLTNNYIHDGNTLAPPGSSEGSALLAADCVSNVTASGNVFTGRNGANTIQVQGGSNVHLIGNLTDLTSYQANIAGFQAWTASGCASGQMIGNEYENSIIIGEGGGGGYTLLGGTPVNSPTIKNNDYYAYDGGAAIGSGTGAYGDSDPVSEDPRISGWAYGIASSSPVFKPPVSFMALVGGWGPPGYVLPETGTPPSSPH